MQHLFFYLLGLIDAHLVRQIQFLKAQNEILRSRLGKDGPQPAAERKHQTPYLAPGEHTGGAVSRAANPLRGRGASRRFGRRGSGGRCPRGR